MKYRSVILILFGLMTMSSCRVFYPNEMFKQKDYQFFEFAKKQSDEYHILPGDQLSIKVYSRDGFKLIDVLGEGESNMTIGGEGSGGANTTSFTLDNEGFVKLPILGEFYAKGYSHKELELVLAERYSSLFVNPYVVVRVLNRRVFVFKGVNAVVVNLNQSKTSLIEVIARSGGLDRSLKAYNIRIIRGDIKNPQVQLVDLSTLEGMRKAELGMEPNDIIYISQRKRIVADAFAEAAPFISATGLILSTVILIRTIGK